MDKIFEERNASDKKWAQYNMNLMYDPEGLELKQIKLTSFPRDHTLSVLLHP